MTLNGVRHTPDVINGAKYREQNGIGRRDYDKTRMSWDGNHLAPPEPGCVLYLPGNPGFGSTIFDYSYNFNDSGIDTDEALDGTEPGIDCDADATTAIPVGSIIIIENEWCKVTATGASLTVIRGYHGTIATTHDTNKDIRVWHPNHGTITGATWTRLPSGLWYLDFDGNDDCITITHNNSINFERTDSFSALSWVKLDSPAAGDIIFAKQLAIGGFSGYGFDLSAAFLPRLALINDVAGNWLQVSGSTALNDSKWHRVGFSYNGLSVASGVVLYVDGKAETPTVLQDVLTATIKTTVALRIGTYEGLASYHDGTQALISLFNRRLSGWDFMVDFQKTRYLFGV